MTVTRWYEEGIRFECTACGDCCKTHGESGEYAYVYLSNKDVDRIAEYLKMPRLEFLNAYCALDAEGDVHLAKLEGDCSFLEEGNRCRVYPVRPKQCATWPFWRENLKKTVWEGPVSACCPGIGRGRLYARDEIDALADERRDWYRK